jgi:hypothetical protein
VQIFNRVLSAAEVQALFNAGAAGQLKAVRVSDPAVVPTGGFTFHAVANANPSPQTVATFTDPGGPEALADYSALITWGDDSAATTGTISFDTTTGVFTVQGSHSYAQTGNYTVTVTVQHDMTTAVMATSMAQVTPNAPLAPRVLSSVVVGSSSSETVPDTSSISDLDLVMISLTQRKGTFSTLGE